MYHVGDIQIPLSLLRVYKFRTHHHLTLLFGFLKHFRIQKKKLEITRVIRFQILPVQKTTCVIFYVSLDDKKGKEY